MINLSEFMTDPNNVITEWDGNVFRKRAICKDGFSISIQGSRYHRSAASKDRNRPFFNLELGFPSEPEPLMLAYADNAKKPTDTVYYNVPWSIVEEVLQKHGGIIKAQEQVLDPTTVKPL